MTSVYKFVTMELLEQKLDAKKIEELKAFKQKLVNQEKLIKKGEYEDTEV